MKCKICNSSTTVAFKNKILNKYNINYYKCTDCGFMFTEEPYWLNEAYASSINLSDTGIMSRNIFNAKLTTNLLYYIFDKNFKCVDYAGGYGIFTRLMRDCGFDFYWSDKYSQNLVARGFEFNHELEKIDLVTLFEVLEHLENPKEDLKKIIEISDTLIFSTELIQEDVPNKDWWYYAFEHGQHISFYSEKTFNILANQLNVNYYKLNNNYHIFSKRKVNKYILKLLIGRFNYFFYRYALSKMQSLSWNDHIKMKNCENTL